MGISTLVGQADGTTDAAAMYCNTTGWMIGPVWEAPDAPEQIEAFLAWLSETGVPASLRVTLALDGPDGLYRDGRDVRQWRDTDLEKIISHWRGENTSDDGWLLDPYECACGPGHTHLGENGETARHGECVYEKQGCACTTWKPGNKAAASAAESE